LNLADNQLSTLPSSIGNLMELCNLDVRNNNLHGLPESIGSMENLYRQGTSDKCPVNPNGLQISGNPLTDIPQDVVEKGSDAIKHYLHYKTLYLLQPFMLRVTVFGGIVVLTVLGFQLKHRRMSKRKKKGQLHS
jgi:Leucine-rich repeat (LRR) protein